MCKICVSEGRMTQEELDEANANGTDAADFAAARALLDGDRAFLDGDPAVILAAMLAGESRLDPEAEAQAAMDETARILLASVGQSDEKYGSPETAVELCEAIDRDAARMMLKCQPATIAISLATITRRYAALLGQWAELYTKAAIGDDDTIDLDAARTAEAKEAVTRATGSDHKTGMYL